MEPGLTVSLQRCLCPPCRAAPVSPPRYKRPAPQSVIAERAFFRCSLSAISDSPLL